MLRLSQSDNVHEAALAAARAEEIMARHGIERAMAEVETPEGGTATHEEIRDYNVEAEGQVAYYGTPWNWRLFIGLAGLHACDGYFSHRYVPGPPRADGTVRQQRTKSLEIVGRPHDVQVVRYLYNYLRAEVERLARMHGRGMGSTWRNNFAIGAADELVARLQGSARAVADRYRRAAAGNDKALVVVERALAAQQARGAEVGAWVKENLYLVGGRSGGAISFNPTARKQGKYAARSVRLGRGRGALGPGT